MAVQDVNLLFSTECGKIKVFFGPIRIQSDNQTNQSVLDANTWKWRQARENARDQVTIELYPWLIDKMVLSLPLRRSEGLVTRFSPRSWKRNAWRARKNVWAWEAKQMAEIIKFSKEIFLRYSHLAVAYTMYSCNKLKTLAYSAKNLSFWHPKFMILDVECWLYVWH